MLLFHSSGNRDKWSVWTKDNGVPETVGASVEACRCLEKPTSLHIYLTQRLSVAVQRGNAASVLGTMKMGSQEEEFFV